MVRVGGQQAEGEPEGARQVAGEVLLTLRCRLFLADKRPWLMV